LIFSDEEGLRSVRRRRQPLKVKFMQFSDILLYRLVTFRPLYRQNGRPKCILSKIAYKAHKKPQCVTIPITSDFSNRQEL